MEPLSGPLRAARLALVLSFAACAALSEEAPQTTSVAVDGPRVPTATGDSTPATTAVSNQRLPGATARDGMALRWQQDLNWCIARPSEVASANDLLTLQPCSNSNRQAWVLAQGKLNADGNLCVAYAGQGNRLWLRPCAEGNMTNFHFNGGAAYDFLGSSAKSPDLLTFLCVNGNVSKTGTPVTGDASTSFPTDSHCSWNVTGLGTSGGSLLSYGGDANACLRHEAGQLRVRPCSSTDANQRWSLVSGDLANSANNCVVSLPSLPALAIIACSAVSNTPNNNQGWVVYNWLQYASSDQNKTAYVLTQNPAGDASISELTPKASFSRNRDWYVGGYLVDAP